MKKILVVALDINPLVGSECGVANIWVKIISRHYLVHVVTPLMHKRGILTDRYENVHFHYVDTLAGPIPKLIHKLKIYNLANKIFVMRARPLIRRLINENDFKLMHIITPAGIHSYSDLYKFNLPLVIGPLGGGLTLPKGFKKVHSRNIFKSFFRDAYYYLLKYNPDWKKYFTRADRIIIGTPYLLNVLPQGIEHKAEMIFDTTVDPEVYKNLHLPKSGISIIYVGRMEPHKGCELLLRSFIFLANEYDDLVLKFVGDGSQLAYLKGRARESGLDKRILFFGEVDRDQVITLLNESDIFCLPTLREPGGVSILEAMSCELPIVTTDYGGPSFSVTDETGIKIKPANYDSYLRELTSSLKFLVDNEKVRKQMGRKGRERVIKEYSPGALESKILKVYAAV